MTPQTETEFSTKDATAKEAEAVRKKEQQALEAKTKADTEPSPPQEGFDLTPQTETELSAKDATAKEAEAVRKKEQQALEAKTKADTEAKDFELGIQGSGKDVSAKQSDLLGLGREQSNRQTTAKTEPVSEAKPESIQTNTHKKKKSSQPKVNNPQTLEDFELSVRENGKESLTTAQRTEYERLNAEAQAQAREQQQTKTATTEGLAADQPLEIEPITEGTHTKTGKPVYNVKVTTKLGKEKFAEAAKTARTMGGSYYKGQFSLPTREKAEQFTNWLNGQTLDHSHRTLEKQTTKASATAAKLRTIADKLEEKGNAEYNAERRTNTAKQLDQATSARAAATKKIKFAQTLRNIANGIDDGSVRFLSKLSSQTQLDELNKIQRSAIPESMIESDYNGYSMSRTVKEGVTLEDYIDRITIPEITLHRDNAVKLAEQMKGKRGYAELHKELEKNIALAIRNDKRTISFLPHSEHAAKLDTFIRNNNEANPGWLFKENMETVKRLQRMGLTTDEQLRSAIRELDEIRSGKAVSQSADHKLDGMRLAIKQNARNYNDFFPTPDDVTNRVMELADVQPGMKTLEPNTGMGHIAKKLQNAAGKEHVDLVEISPQLVEYLETAGFGKVEQSDFLKFGEKNSYDRIVMNPPFSKDQDIDHVMHAYDLIKPGGRVTAIMSNMAGLRSNKKNRAFSAWMDEVGATVEDIEPGAFKSSFNPTSVNTKIVVIDKPKVEAKAQATKAKYNPDDIDYDRAYAASQHISHSPQKRARSIQDGYVEHMEGLEKELSALATSPEQKAALANELALYKEGYIKHLYAWLDADANTVSPMIAGRSNFNYKRNDKRLSVTDRKREEFIEWQQRAQDGIKRELSDSRTPDQVESDDWNKIKNDIDGSFVALYHIDQKKGRYADFNKSLFTRSIHNRLITLAKDGDVENVNRALEHIKQLQEGMNKPAFTNRNKIWKLGEEAQQARTAQNAPTQAAPVEDPSSYSFDGGTIVRNTNEDRLQIIFDGKPDAAMRDKLKGAGWRWNPTNKAWQRKLTANAEYSAQDITGAKSQPDISTSSAKTTTITSYQPVTLNKFQKTAIKRGGHGLAGELDTNTINSLLAMRDNPNLPSLEQHTTKKGSTYYTGDIPWHDVGNGISVKGYKKGSQVVQKIKLPNGMEMERILDGDGKIHGSFAGDYEQIVEGKGYDEAREAINAFYAARKPQNQTTQKTLSKPSKDLTPPGITLNSAPFIPAAREAASLLHLNPGASGFGAVHGAIAADQISEEEKFSKQWWLDTFAGATVGAFASAGGILGLKRIPIKGRTVLGDNSWGSQSLNLIKKGWQKVPGMNPGDPDIIPLKKRQTLMKAVIEKQAEQAGEYLLKNFTPQQRGVMADLIEQRGIVAGGNLLHRQAKELDDFIGYTAKKLQELDMLDSDIEPGGYLHRYYSKHLGITGLAKPLTPKGQAISGTWSRRRGTSEVYDSKYMSQSMRDTMDKIQQLRDEYSALRKQAGDLVSTDTQTRLNALKAEYTKLEKTEFREYLAPENGELKSFFLAEDEVPIIPGLKRKASTELETIKQGSLEGMGTAPKRGSTGELVLTDRRWTIDGKQGSNAGILHRDWTKAERESWERDKRRCLQNGARSNRSCPRSKPWYFL